jgi:Ankyrin repeats (3 copies)
VRVRKLVEGHPALAKADDNYHKTPLHLAAQQGHREVAEYLLSKGADVNAQDQALATPLEEAAAADHPDLVDFLLSKGADLHIQCVSGGPTRIAALLGHVDVVRILIEKGADPNGKDSSGETPLHSAVRFEDPNVSAMVKLLLSKGANILSKDDRNDRTPLHIAAEESPLETIQLLISKGADVNARTKTLETPLHSVVQRTWRPKKEIASLLLSEEQMWMQEICLELRLCTKTRGPPTGHVIDCCLVVAVLLKYGRKRFSNLPGVCASRACRDRRGSCHHLFLREISPTLSRSPVRVYRQLYQPPNEGKMGTLSLPEEEITTRRRDSGGVVPGSYPQTVLWVVVERTHFWV